MHITHLNLCTRIRVLLLVVDNAQETAWSLLDLNLIDIEDSRGPDARLLRLLWRLKERA